MRRIYSLVDPRDGRVRYVGQTKRLLCQRIGQHIDNARRGVGGGAPVREWIAGLLSVGMRPTIALLDIVPSDAALAAETRWIASFTDLLNVSPGGGAKPPKNWRNEPMPVPPEAIALLGTMSDARLGARFGVSKYTTARWRRQRGVQSYAETTGDDGRIKRGEPHRRWCNGASA